MDYLADKSWMYKYTTKFSRCDPIFVDGVHFFVEYAKQTKGIIGNGIMLCPCGKCENKFNYDTESIAFHIVRDGFFEGYTTWHFHGESRKRPRLENLDNVVHGREMYSMLNDVLVGGSIIDADVDDEQAETLKFNKMMNEAMKPLYEVERAFHKKNLQHSKETTDLPPILDEVFGRHHGGFERGMGEGWSRRSHQYTASSEAKVATLSEQLEASSAKIDALSTQVSVMQEKEKACTEKMENMKDSQKEELLAMEARMQEQLQTPLQEHM
ncbi:hypothetical protein H6P81_010848 [Aristolochia fimbriata]|uniref:Transposase-associated domain-containing protein n=1 Tax=Aristolochia fimbriata TaxID=158543 RepID=A0AAV7EQ83_ARIFI|nr:hypothetical protein H6P81_010848 [Aristolochia fimbriata]